MGEQRLSDGSGFAVSRLIQPSEHPLRQRATNCAECGGEECVFFNPLNVEVQCHRQGCRERDMNKRQHHLSVWLEAVICRRDEGRFADSE